MEIILTEDTTYEFSGFFHTITEGLALVGMNVELLGFTARTTVFEDLTLSNDTDDESMVIGVVIPPANNRVHK